MKTPQHVAPPPGPPDPSTEELRAVQDQADLSHVVKLLAGVLDNLVANEERMARAHDGTLQAIIRHQASAEKEYLAMLVAWLAARDPVLDVALKTQFAPDPSPTEPSPLETTTDSVLSTPAPIPLGDDAETRVGPPPHPPAPMVPAPLPPPPSAGSAPPKERTLSLNLGAMRNIRG